MARNMKTSSLPECNMGLLFISFVVMRPCSIQGSSIEKEIGVRIMVLMSRKPIDGLEETVRLVGWIAAVVPLPKALEMKHLISREKYLLYHNL